MIRMLASTDAGMVIVIGIVEANVELMRAGRPLHLDLGAFLKQGYGEDVEEMPDEGRMHLMVYYGTTHRAIVKRLEAEMRSSGLSIDPAYWQAAEQLDAQLAEERS